jgi:hypothetical protein
MSFTLILPVAGKSSRFPNMRPKWLLTMPDGKLMYEKSVEGIDCKVFDRIVIVCLKEHVDKYSNKDGLLASFKKATDTVPEILMLEEATNSQSETIFQALKKSNITGSFFIKDCDNVFSCDPLPSNTVATIDLNDIELIDAKNKSYVEVDSLGIISNIVEKNVVSNQFCCGGYGFKSAVEFVSAYEGIVSSEEVYISHIIYKMLLEGQEFKTIPASVYQDWGTLREYQHYCKQFLTVFCDVDGVLLLNGSKFGKNGWKTEALVKNVSELRKLQESGFLYLVLTSSRPESEIEYTEKVLKSEGLNVDRFIFGLPHTRRYLINDYSYTNPYPSAVSINLERDSEVLHDLLRI